MQALLSDKVILITGAGGGIGKALALACAEQGATVLLLDRSEKKLNQVYDRIVAKQWPKPAVIPLDLETLTPTIADEIFQIIDQNFGRLDGLVHNAAMLGSMTPIYHYPPEQWLRVMQVNLNAPFLLTQSLLPLLQRPEHASIIFTLADVAIDAKAYWGAYAASKHGLFALTNTLAAELEDQTQIRVNSINPVRARTPLRAKIYPAEAPGDNPLPETLMADYLYLLGPESQGVSGQHFTCEPK